MPESVCVICGSTYDAKDRFCSNCGTQLTKPEARNIHRTLPRSEDFLALGIFMLVVGATVGTFSFLNNIIPLIAFGLGTLFLGIMIIFLPESASFRSDRTALLSSFPSLMNLEALIEDLDINTRGIYIPTTGFGTVPKIVVPMIELDIPPDTLMRFANSNRVFVSVGANPRDRGILLNSPGGAILTALESCLQLDLSMMQTSDLEARLNFGFEVLGISKNTTVRGGEEDLTVEMQLTSLLELEKRLRTDAPRIVKQIGTPLTSAVASALCKAKRKYVKLADSTLQNSLLAIHLTLLQVEAK